MVTQHLARWPAAAPIVPRGSRRRPLARVGGGPRAERPGAVARFGPVPVVRQRGTGMTRRETAFGAGVAYPRPRPAWPMAHRRGRRTGHPGLVHGHTTSRLYGYLGDLPPAEFEGRFHATQQAATAWSKSSSPSLYKTLSGSSLERAHDRLRVSPAAMSRAAGSSSTGTDPAVMVRWILCPRRE
jgi:hypothetical protein